MKPLRAPHSALRTLAALAALALALPCAALPLGLRLAARRAAVEAQSQAETPEELAYRIYAPDTAFEVTVTNGATVAFAITLLSGHASATVDWGDGTTSTHTSSPASHAYAADGSFVVKISDDISVFKMKDDNTFQAVTAFLRWGDSVTRADYCWENWPKGMFNLKGFIPRWGKSITRVENCYRRCYKLTGPVPPWPKNIANATFVYTDCYGLTGSIPAWNDKITSAYSTYSVCSGLTGTVPAWNDKITSAYSTYSGCSGLTGTVPAWNDKITNAGSTYRNCSRLTGAWTDDPAELMPTNITTHGNCVYGASAALRALFYSDWGGTRTKK